MIGRQDLVAPPAGFWRPVLVLVLVFSALVRLAVLAPRFGELVDPDNYLVLARALVEGRGLAMEGGPTAYRPPLYPLVLAPLVGLLGDRLAWGVAGLHLALGMGTVVLTAVTARRWGLTPARGLLASAIVALDPVLLAQSRLVMTETLAAFLVAATLALLADGRLRGAWLGGMAFGLATLCRPSFLPAAGLTALAALVVGPGGPLERARRAGLLLIATAAILAPWASRNACVLGEPVWTTTHGGWTFALANNPVYYAEVLDGPPGAVWSGANQTRWFDAMGQSVAGLTEPEADRRIRDESLRFVARRPFDFGRACLARLSRFWGLAPSGAVYSRATRILTIVWTLPLWVALLLGVLDPALWRWPRVSAPATIVALTLVHAVYWTDLRMRAPLVPAIALVAASAHRLRRDRVPRRVSSAKEGENGDRKKIQNPHGF